MIATALAALALAVWAYLAVGRGGFWRADIRDTTLHDARPGRWPSVAAIVPARNEAEVIGASLTALLGQDYPAERLAIVVVDDQSTDATADRARAAGPGARLRVVAGAPLPTGWVGKVWAMNQAVAALAAAGEAPDYLLFQDADIAFAPPVLARLVAAAESRGSVLVSLMAKLRCASPAERFLVPAFVFFFQKLYPFAWVNDPARSTAAAAGGCMLVRRTALEAAGGLGAIRGAIIDDCALAALLKPHGPIWLGLTEDVASLRPYPYFGDIRRMVARSAYAELRHSPWRVIGAVAGMALTYLVPPAMAVLATGPARWLGLAAWMLMALAYLPMLRFYRQNPLWAVLLPAAAALYTLFTVDSAVQHGRGRGGAWKGRYHAPATRERTTP